MSKYLLLQYGLGVALMVVFAYMNANYPEHTGLFFTLYFVVFLGVLLLLTGRQARGILRDIEQVSRGEVIYEAPSAEVAKLREKDFENTRPELAAQVRYAMLPFLAILLFLIVYSLPWARNAFLNLGRSVTEDAKLANFLSFLAFYGVFYVFSVATGILARRFQSRTGTLQIASKYKVTTRGLLVDDRLPIAFPVKGRITVNSRRKFVELELEQQVMGSRVKQRVRLYSPEPSKLAALLKPYVQEQ
jgi:uncharacterized membrane protein